MKKIQSKSHSNQMLVADVIADRLRAAEVRREYRRAGNDYCYWDTESKTRHQQAVKKSTAGSGTESTAE